MILKTIGSTGDYADFSDAVNSLIGVANILTDNMTFSFLEDITEITSKVLTGDSSYRIFLNGFTLIFDLCGYTWTNNITVLNFRFPGIQINLNASTDWQGIFEIKNGTLISAATAEPSTILLEIDCKGDSTVDSQKILVHDLTIKTFSAYRPIIFYTTSSYWYFYCYNIRAFATHMSAIGREVLMFSGIGVKVAGASHGFFVENCSIYRVVNAGDGIGMYDNNIVIQLKNVVSFGSTIDTGWNDFYNINGDVLYGTPTLINCADGDGSIAALKGTNTDCITGVTSSDFKSTNQTSDDFLKVLDGHLFSNANANPNYGQKPLRVKFLSKIDYKSASKLSGAGIPPELTSKDLIGVVYGSAGIYPIGCFNAEVS